VASSSGAWLGFIATYTLYIYSMLSIPFCIIISYKSINQIAVQHNYSLNKLNKHVASTDIINMFNNSCVGRLFGLYFYTILYIYVGEFDIDYRSCMSKPKGAFSRAAACISMLYHASGGFTSAGSALTCRYFQPGCSVQITSQVDPLKHVLSASAVLVFITLCEHNGCVVFRWHFEPSGQSVQVHQEHFLFLSLNVGFSCDKTQHGGNP
jgi:hypothetical protein